MIKIFGIVLLIPGLLIMAFVYFIYPIAKFWEGEADTTREVYTLINEALQIPYQSYRKVDEPYMYKEEWLDLEPISKEEWLDMKCEHPKPESYLDKKYLAEISAEKKQIHCVMPVFWGEKHPYVNKMPRHCTSIFNCPSIRVTFYDYILEYPKVLNNVIKIMEKPCDYLYEDFPVSTITSYRISKEEREQLIKENKLFTYNGVVHARISMYCDAPKIKFYEKDRTYSVIYILDKDGNKKTEIIVPRKDNAHLIKDNKK